MAEKKRKKKKEYETLEELEKAVDAYFTACDKKNKLYGEAGLALALDVCLKTLQNWYDGKSKPEFQDVIQKAYLRIQDQIETSSAYMEKGGMTTRAIFMLKQVRFGGYQDKIESRQDLTVNVKMGKGMDESDFK